MKYITLKLVLKLLRFMLALELALCDLHARPFLINIKFLNWKHKHKQYSETLNGCKMARTKASDYQKKYREKKKENLKNIKRLINMLKEKFLKY